MLHNQPQLHEKLYTIYIDIDMSVMLSGCRVVMFNVCHHCFCPTDFSQEAFFNSGQFLRWGLLAKRQAKMIFTPMKSKK